MILVIDNYDSFTFNLVQALQAAGAEVHVVRNDAIPVEAVAAMADDPTADLRGIVISPGPGDPDDAGISVGAVGVAAERGLPLLGVCLGMQSMAVAFGASIVRAPTLVHGEASEVTPRRPGPARGHAAGIHGRALPLPRGRHRDAPARAARDRDERGRPGRHGHPPRRAAARGGPVPPGVRPDPAGAAPPRELPAPGR